MLLINLKPNVKAVVTINGEKVEVYNLEKTIAHLGFVTDNKKNLIYREDCEPRGKHVRKKKERLQDELL